MRHFKGQAALEFMMTYGWAILVVLAAIGALSYFGILNPSRFTPDTCISSSGFACPGKPVVTANTMTFSIVNGLGFPVILTNATGSVTITNINCSTANICPQGQLSCAAGAGEIDTITVQDGAGVTVTLRECGATNVNVIKGEVNLGYINPQSQLPEKIKVAITAKPQT